LKINKRFNAGVAAVALQNRGLPVRFLPGLLRVEASAYGAHRVAIDNTRGGHDVSGPTLGGKL